MIFKVKGQNVPKGMSMGLIGGAFVLLSRFSGTQRDKQARLDKANDAKHRYTQHISV